MPPAQPVYPRVFTELAICAESVLQRLPAGDLTLNRAAVRRTIRRANRELGRLGWADRLGNARRISINQKDTQ